jgi:hypothetical protein
MIGQKRDMNVRLTNHKRYSTNALWAKILRTSRTSCTEVSMNWLANSNGVAKAQISVVSSAHGDYCRKLGI